MVSGASTGPPLRAPGELQVKIYQPVTARVMVICLNVSTEEHYLAGVQPGNPGADGESLRHPGLPGDGGWLLCWPVFKRLPGPCRPALPHPCLAARPTSWPSCCRLWPGSPPLSASRFEDFFIRSMADIPFGATLILVTALVPESLQDTLLRLRRYRPHITLISAPGNASARASRHTDDSSAFPARGDDAESMKTVQRWRARFVSHHTCGSTWR